MGQSIPVARSDLPGWEDFLAILRRAWDANWLTNQGMLHEELTAGLRRFLGIPLELVSNGTTAIELALRVLRVQGDVVTTPFTFPATTNAIQNCALRPVFADIDAASLNLAVDAVEDATTKSTGGVLPVHVYGNPCDVEGFQEWSTRYARPVIYDAAHAFGVEVAGRSVLASGDASTLSFHATKLFHTAEGGAVAAMDEKVLAGLRLLRNNGIRAEYDHVGEGTNAKLSELHAAMGLANLEHTGERLRCRAAVAQWYKQGLPSNLQRPRCDASRPNNAYMPVVMASEDQLLRTVKALHAQGIRPRRYFYPLTSDPSAWSATPVASDIAPRALCLPMYASLSQADVERICAIVRDVA